MIANLLMNSLPKISQTEWQALEAGSVWIDGEYFTGNPDFKRILAENYDQLPKEERAFLDGPCQELIEMFDRYEVAETRIIPDEVMQFLKDKGFMALLIPKEYGGLAFSTLGISSVMAKLSPYSAIIGTLVVIPNSLGAAELIKHYGTQEQKDHYLPKLADRRLRCGLDKGRGCGVQGQRRRTQGAPELREALYHQRAAGESDFAGLQDR